MDGKRERKRSCGKADKTVQRSKCFFGASPQYQNKFGTRQAPLPSALYCSLFVQEQSDWTQAASRLPIVL